MRSLNTHFYRKILNRLQQIWDKHHKIMLWSSGGVIVVIAIGTVTWGIIQEKNADRRTEYREWLSVFVTPIVIGGGGYLLNQQFQQAQDRRAEQERQEKERLSKAERQEQREQEEFKTYLDKMERLVKEGINSEADDTFKMAQALTANVLRELTEERQNQVMFFLESLNLVGKPATQPTEDGFSSASLSLFRGIRLVKANLQNLYAQEFGLSAATLTQANLVEASLKKAYLWEANLEGANLQKANLWGANFTGANLVEANLIGAILWEAKLKKAELRMAILKRAILKKADLTEAGLIGADLTGAYLNQANLTGAWLIAADLTGANLWEANLTAAVLNNVKLENVLFCNTIMPDGTVRNDHCESLGMTPNKTNKPDNS